MNDSINIIYGWSNHPRRGYVVATAKRTPLFAQRREVVAGDWFWASGGRFPAQVAQDQADFGPPRGYKQSDTRSSCE